jgi:DNA-binding FrmR family transcriptional regulator
VDSLEKEENFEGKCFNIIQQNLAVIGLLKAANVSILENYLDFYIENIDKTTKKADVEKMKQEILRIVQTAQKK